MGNFLYICSMKRKHEGLEVWANNHQLIDYDLVLDEKFGKEGTPERIKAETEAYNEVFKYLTNKTN